MSAYVSQANRKLAFNTLAYIASYGVTLAISFFLTPYLVRVFGRETYSFYTISNNIVSYMMIVSNALNGMACRKIVIEIKRNNLTEANNYYKSIFMANMAISLFMIIVMTVLVLFMDRVMDIPEGNTIDIKLLFALTFLSMLINLMSSLLGISTIACDRIDLRAYRETAAAVIKLALIYLAFTYLVPKMRYLGAIIVIVACFNSIIQYLYTSRLLPFLKLRNGAYSFAKVTEVFVSGFWNTLNALGGNLLTGITIILLNILISAEASSYISIVHTPIGLLNGTITAVLTALYPRMLISYSESREQLKTVVPKFQKILAVFTNVTVAGIIVLGQDFYRLWMPEVDSTILQTVTLIQIVSIFFIGNVHILTNVNTILLNIKIPAISLCVASVINIFGSVLLIRLFDVNMYGVIVYNVLIVCIYYAVFIPVYTCKKMNETPMRVYANILKSGAAVTLSFFAGRMIRAFFGIDSWIRFFFQTGICAVLFLAINLIVMFDFKGAFRRYGS